LKVDYFLTQVDLIVLHVVLIALHVDFFALQVNNSVKKPVFSGCIYIFKGFHLFKRWNP